MKIASNKYLVQPDKLDRWLQSKNMFAYIDITKNPGYSPNYLDYLDNLDNLDNLCNQDIYLGSNLSNVEYLYKLISEYTEGIYFIIPHVKGSSIKNKKVMLKIDRYAVYSFCYNVSNVDQLELKFMDLLDIESNKSIKPVYTICSESMDLCQQSIDIYEQFIEDMWEDIIKPFVSSSDCMIRNFLKDTDYWIFEEFMKSQPVYRAALCSMEKLDKLYKLNI